MMEAIYVKAPGLPVDGLFVPDGSRLSESVDRSRRIKQGLPESIMRMHTNFLES
jgi:hypothetical protein